MTEREKVINGIEHHMRGECGGCPYCKGWHACEAVSEKGLFTAALALLKAQEPDEDWISRKRLWNEIQYYIDEAGWGDAINKVLGWCLEFIDNQEAVKWE